MKKRFIYIGVLVVLIIIVVGVVASRGTKAPGEKLEEAIFEEQGTPSLKGGEKSEVMECVKGTLVKAGGQEFTITGIEKQIVGEQSMDLCCGEMREGEKLVAKYCGDKNVFEGDYVIMWNVNQETGELSKVMETYRQDEKECVKFFDAQGNIMTESCE